MKFLIERAELQKFARDYNERYGTDVTEADVLGFAMELTRETSLSFEEKFEKFYGWKSQPEIAAKIIGVIEVSINDLKAENVEHKESGATSDLIGNFIINVEESLARLQEELLMEVESSGDKAAKAVLETLDWDKIEEDDTTQD